jgi:hypothetical protein
VALFKVIGSPGYPMEEDWIHEVAGQSYDRSFDPAGVARQGLVRVVVTIRSISHRYRVHMTKTA